MKKKLLDKLEEILDKPVSHYEDEIQRHLENILKASTTITSYDLHYIS